MAEKEKKKGISPAVIIIPAALGLAAVGVIALAAAGKVAPAAGRASLSGKVTGSQTGEVIPDVLITLDGLQTSTDAQGNYSFPDVATDSYGIFFEKGGYHTTMLDITLAEGTNTLNVQLVPITAPVANLYGVVIDAETGYALQGVKVTLDSWVAYTDSSGYYSFTNLSPGAYSIKFEKEGYETKVL